MSNFENNRVRKEEAKERDKVSRENLGKFFYDLARTSFTAMVAGGAVSFITDMDNEVYLILLALGVFSTCTFAYLGYKIIRR